MAKKSQSQSQYFELLKDIRKGQFAPVYLLMGEEAYYIDMLTELLQKSVVTEEERDFNFTVLYGADVSIDMVVNAARRYPVMADRQIVLLKEAQALNDAKRQLEKLLPYATNPVASTVLVITFKGDTLSATSKFVKEVQKCGVVFNSERLKEWQLPPVIREYCKEKSIKIDDKSVAMLAEFIGDDLSRLFGEIDKLTVTIADKSQPITPELIERNIGFSKDFNNFELVNAIAARNYVKTMRIVDYFERNPKQNPVVVVTPTLFNFFSNLLLAYYAPDKSEQGLMQQLRLKSSYALKNYITALPLYNARRVIAIISAIRELDCKSKGIKSAQKDYSLLKELIYKIFTL